MINVVIIGASGHGFQVADLAHQIGYSIIFWDDKLSSNNKNIYISNRKSIIPSDSKLIIGIGSNKIREIISKQYSLESFISLFHPKSIIAKNTKIGVGSVVMAGVIINNNVDVGNHCILNTGAVIEHDCIIDDFVHISPNSTICGNVKIGKGAWVGAGATIIQGIRIGDYSTIGAGAVIINDIPNNATVVGNPGKIIKSNQI
jgi:sugar O-acyltransferase (sialic acid O-acetyltransferase NeuD family)